MNISLNHSISNLINLKRRRDSNSIDTAARISAEREKEGSLNVVVGKTKATVEGLPAVELSNAQAAQP